MPNNTEVKPDEFQVGDVVWCVLRGKGVVAMVLTAKDFNHCPIIVDFAKTVNPVTGETYSNRHSYTKDGKWFQDFSRTLFFSEPKIEASVTRPFVPTLVGKKVFVLEYACYPQVFVVTWEDESMFGNDEYKCIKSNSTVYEVSSENLLTK